MLWLIIANAFTYAMKVIKWYEPCFHIVFIIIIKIFYIFETPPLNKFNRELYGIFGIAFQIVFYKDLTLLLCC